MKVKIKTITFLFSVLVVTHGAYAFDVFVKDIETEAYVKQEYNRSFEYCWDISVVGAATFFERVALRGGLLYGGMGDVGDFKAFVSARVAPLPNRPWWGLRVLYMYNELTDYDISSHSILPLVSVDFFRFRGGLSFGFNSRFISFFGEPSIYESMISYSWYYDFIRNERWRLRMALGNYDDFYAKQSFGFGGSSVKLNSEIYLAGNWTVVNEIQFQQRGNEPFSTNFYGLAWRGGAKYSW